jgi:hypothetical protein
MYSKSSRAPGDGPASRSDDRRTDGHDDDRWLVRPGRAADSLLLPTVRIYLGANEIDPVNRPLTLFIADR